MNISEKKKNLEKLIELDDKSISYWKPEENPKRSLVWESFSIVCINRVKQEVVSCDKCKKLLMYRQRDGTTSLAKHKRSCEDDIISSTNNSCNQTQVTEYFVSTNASNIPKNLKQRVKIACTEFVALDSRPFEIVSGNGFMKMAQSLFDAGKHFNPSSNVSLKDLIPSPVTVKTLLLRKIYIMYSSCVFLD